MTSSGTTEAPSPPGTRPPSGSTWSAARRPELAAAFAADGAFDPEATRAALSRLEVPVLVVAGSHDVGNPPPVMQQVAAAFPDGELVVQEGAGHFPWFDDGDRFVRLVAPFLARP